MTITNYYGYPDVIVRIAKAMVREPQPDGVITVTELTKGARERELTRRHWKEISVDVSELWYSLYGQMMHKLFELYPSDDTINEIRFPYKFQNFELSGQADVYNTKTQTIEDYKWVKSSYNKYSDEIKPEWIYQLNCLKFLFEAQGYIVKRLQVHLLFRDFEKADSFKSDGPERPVKTLNIPLLTNTEIINYIELSAKKHNYGNWNGISDDDIPICSEKERWKDKDLYAIIKNNGSRATKICDSYEEAVEHINYNLSNKSDYYIDKREGINRKCVKGACCLASQFCSFRKSLNISK